MEMSDSIVASTSQSTGLHSHVKLALTYMGLMTAFVIVSLIYYSVMIYDAKNSPVNLCDILCNIDPSPGPCDSRSCKRKEGWRILCLCGYCRFTGAICHQFI